MLIYLSAALAAGAGLVSWTAARKEAAAQNSHPPEGRIVEVDGTRLHAVVLGDGPDVVLIHGSGGNTRDMTFALAPALAARYRVTVIDRPGLGYSDPIGPNGGTIFRQAELLQRTAQALGARRPVVMGQSYGGAVALAWAIRHPGSLAALVPVAAASHPWDTPLDPFYRITSSRLGQIVAVPLITALTGPRQVENALAGVFAPQPVPPGYARHFGPGLTLRRASLRANALQRANLLDEIKALQAHYEQIDLPTEIVHGTADDTVNIALHSETLARRIPGAVLTRLEGVGHMPQHVATEQVVAAIDRAAARAGLR